MSDRLAVDGGAPVRTTPFPRRTPYSEREVELVSEAIRSQNLFGPSGTFVPRFLDRFAQLYGAKHAAASTSGTAAIHVAVGTINPEPGDEIITAPITDLGTIVPILYQNAIPIFADVDHTYNMDPADVEAKITPRTKAIIAVHLFGNPCDMDALLAIARRHGVALIEDCSQAHLTAYKGQLCGTFGDIGAFSLQQSKHLTTGDGGVTITNDDALWERMRFFVDKGWARREWGPRTYVFLAPNYRMTELQGAVGVAQAEKVQAVVDRRHHLGDLISTLIRGQEGITAAPVTPGGRHTYWLYPMRVDAVPAAEFARALTAEGVPAGAGYIQQPIYMCAEALANKVTFGTSHVPFIPAFTDRTIEYGPGLCPRTEEALAHMVTIGINENFSDEDVHDIARAIRKVAQGMLVAR
jgi:perosamine synthetase